MRRGVTASARVRKLSTVEWFGLNEGIQPTGASAIIALFYSGAAPITTMTPALGGSPGTPIAIIDQPSASVPRDIGLWWVESPASNVLTGASYYEATPRVLWVRGASPGEYRTSYSNNPYGNSPTGDIPPHQPAVNPGGLIFSLYGFRSATPPTAQHPFIDTGVFAGGMAGQGAGCWTVGSDYPSWPINRYYAMATFALNPKEV